MQTLRPDMLITSQSTRTQIVVELTVPLEKNVEERHEDKLRKYRDLPAAGEANGWRVEVVAVEMGCLGGIAKSMERLLRELRLGPNALKRATRELSNAARRTSFVLYQSRHNAHWTMPGLMSGKDGQSLDAATVEEEEREDQERQLAQAAAKATAKRGRKKASKIRRRRERARASAHA